MANYEKFKQMYAANFHRLTDVDGEQFWSEFVEKCDGEILKEAVERLAEVVAINKTAGRQTSAPKLAEIKAQYYTIKTVSDEKRRTAAIGKSTCGYCDGLGSVIIVVHAGKLVDVRRPPVAPYPLIAWYVHPCRCSIGYLNVSEAECSMQSRVNAVKNSIPWSMEHGEQIIGGEEAAWNLVWECDRRYTEAQKQIRIEND
jgi:hypothetical protein